MVNGKKELLKVLDNLTQQEREIFMQVIQVVNQVNYFKWGSIDSTVLTERLKSHISKIKRLCQ